MDENSPHSSTRTWSTLYHLQSNYSMFLVNDLFKVDTSRVTRLKLTIST